MKSSAAKINKKHTSRVISRKPSTPFFQKNSSAEEHSAQMTHRAQARLRFDKAQDNFEKEADEVANQEVENRSESPVNEEGRSSGGELILLTIDTKEEKKKEELSQAQFEGEEAPLYAEPPVRSKVSEASEASDVGAESEFSASGSEVAISAPVSLPSAAPSAPLPLAESLSDIGQQFNTLPPSAQAETYSGFGAALNSSFADRAAQTQDAVPDLSATLEGVAEPSATPNLSTPPPTPSIGGQALARAPEPVVEVPAAPEQEPVGQPELPSPQQAEAGKLDEALGVIDPAPAIETTLEPPEIPLEGNANPVALDSLESAAAGEAENLLGAAQTGVAEVSPEVVQPLAMDEIVNAPVLPDVQLPDQTPRVEGMDQLAGYALGPLDRAAFDDQIGPSMQAAEAGAQAELSQREQNFEQERAGLHLEADAEAAAAQEEAQANQRLEIEQGRQALAGEQQRTLDQQQAAADGALGELSTSKEASAQEIDGRLAADRAAVDEVYAAVEADAQAEVERGTGEADEAGKSAAQQAEAESWWDWAIDSWQALVQAVAGKIIAIWESVAEAVAGFLNRAIALASTIVSGAVAFVKQVLSAYFDLWARLVDKLLGSIFPGLAAALKAWIDRLRAAVFAALDAVAAFYLQALRFIADKLVAGLYAALEVYKAGVNAYLALWETIQNSSWSDIGKTLLSGLLTVVGIDPKEFFATFSKADEVVDDIVADPTLIGKRAVEALSLGIQQFGTNFISNFTAAFVEWITGAARIIMPKTFSLAGIFDVVCQVLNLTYDYLREKAVQHLGEGAVTAVEELFAAIKAFIAEGWAGLWNFVKDKLTSLVDDVVIAMGSWLVEKAILVAGRWVAGLIATFGWSALVEGLIALWQFAMWVKDQFQRFWQIIKSTIDSVHEFVKGQIQPAADTIEGTLQDLIIPAIDLVAKLLNLGNIAKKVEQIIEAVRQMIDEAIDGVVEMLLGTLGIKSKKASDEEDEGGFDGQVGEEIHFNVDGKGHKLWIDTTASEATVMVNSTPMTVEERLDNWQRRIDDPPSQKDGEGGPRSRDEANASLSKAYPQLGTVDQEAEQTLEAETEARDKQDQKTEAAENTLAASLKKLFELYGDEFTAGTEDTTGVPVSELRRSFTMVGTKHELWIEEVGDHLKLMLASPEKAEADQKLTALNMAIAKYRTEVDKQMEEGVESGAITDAALDKLEQMEEDLKNIERDVETRVNEIKSMKPLTAALFGGNTGMLEFEQTQANRIMILIKNVEDELVRFGEQHGIDDFTPTAVERATQERLAEERLAAQQQDAAAEITEFNPQLNLPDVPATQRLRMIMRASNKRVVFRRHAMDRMEGRNVTEENVIQTLAAGRVDRSEYENGEWRYQVFIPQYNIIFAFMADEVATEGRRTLRLDVVTVWPN